MEWVYSQRKRRVREEISKEKVKKKGKWEAYNINKQTVYLALKSKIESRVHYAPKPTRGPPVKNWGILSVQSFTARMPLLTATSAFELGKRLWSSAVQCYLRLLRAIIHRVKRRHRVFGHNTIAILWVQNDIMH